MLDGCGVPGIGNDSEGSGTSAVGQVLRGILEDILRPAGDWHRRTVVGKAAGGSQSHAATAAGDDGGGVPQPEVHGASALGACPVGLALLGKCDRAFLGVDLLLPHPDTIDPSPVARYC
jgi:hypothetical protein